VAGAAGGTGGGASAGFGWIAADRSAGSAVGLAASGLALGTGTVRLARCGIEAGGRGTPLTRLIGASGSAEP